tara:strand:+ start:930 stop:1319 length:390 start_codon:yes stop_codon:yes gene_type:complete
MPATIVLTGRLASDPERRSTNSGTTVVELVIPNDSGWGEHKVTTWWRATLFGKRAEVAAEYLRKGSWVTVTGDPAVEEYERRAGGKGFSPKIKATSWEFVGPKVEAGASAPRPAGTPPNSYSSDDSVPF